MGFKKGVQGVISLAMSTAPEKPPFDNFLEETFRFIQERLEEELGDTVEIDRTEDTLSIELEDGQHYYLSTMVIRESIGLSSPLSGRRTFYYDKEKNSWLSIRDNSDLYELLGEEFTTLCGATIRFD
ncbi:MAG: hypothetical protein COA65_03770 [Rhodospirillaceae bacterium]|nr:MAG: hypothetical protein COA65_03770 [Rhodospirillaceae bacterium]